ncbi:MAG: orotidine-5'-phosphate decarboxylase [Thermodesulfovibrionia bacterium]
MDVRERIILALDVSSHEEALRVVREFKGQIDIFKIGSELFTSVGPIIVDEINSMGKRVFLDLKYHDIPNTVRRSVEACARLGVFMLTVHAMGGLDMMRQAVEGVVDVSLKGNIPKPMIFGVTILTSIDRRMLTEELGITHNITLQVRHLAGLAIKAGLDGVVASPNELEVLRFHFGKELLIVTPGIRPLWSQQDDQKRTMTPREALTRGADYLVIGRPIISHPRPQHALELLIRELSGNA